MKFIGYLLGKRLDLIEREYHPSLPNKDKKVLYRDVGAESAAGEQDPDKLTGLLREIDQLNRGADPVQAGTPLGTASMRPVARAAEFFSQLFQIDHPPLRICDTILP